MFITLIVYLLIYIYIFFKSLYYITGKFSKSSHKMENFQIISSIMVIPFYSNTQNIYFFIIFANLSLIFIDTTILAFCMDNANINREFEECSENVKKYHNEASRLNDSICSSFSKKKLFNPIFLETNDFGKNLELDSYNQTTLNRFIHSIDSKNNPIIIDQQNYCNICIEDPSKILSCKPYLKYEDFFKLQYEHFSSYDLTKKPFYLNHQNIALYLTKTTSVLNNLTIEYLESSSSRINITEMDFLFNNSKRMFQQTFVYIEQESYKQTNVIPDGCKIELQNIYDLSTENIDLLYKIFKKPTMDYFEPPKRLSNLYPFDFNIRK